MTLRGWLISPDSIILFGKKHDHSWYPQYTKEFVQIPRINHRSWIIKFITCSSILFLVVQPPEEINIKKWVPSKHDIYLDELCWPHIVTSQQWWIHTYIHTYIHIYIQGVIPMVGFISAIFRLVNSCNSTRFVNSSHFTTTNIYIYI